MYIHQIYIDNFKSFAEKTTIPFRKGFTTVSGPNGSGKSNIIDSILFCLGLSTSRTMRAEKVSDLINNLSKRKECLVTITFRKEPNEVNRVTEESNETQLNIEVSNKDIIAKGQVNPSSAPGSTPESTDTRNAIEKKLNIDPKLDPKEFVTVSRRIKGTSSGYTSTYFLNGSTSTLTQIHECLGQFNISPGSFNVMMQGDVAGFVNMSGVERRKIIDEIAGVAEFDRKIEQAQRELEATGANIERNTILLDELIARLEQLSTERETALKYQKLRDEKQDWENKLLSSKYLDIKKSLEAAKQNITEAQKGKTGTETTLRGLVDIISQTRQSLLKISEEVKKKGEDQQIALKKQIEGLKGHIDRKENTIQFNDEQITKNLASIKAMEGDIVRHQETIEGIDTETEGFNHQLKELQAFYDKEAKAYESLNQQFDKITESSGELSSKRTDVRQKLNAEEYIYSQLTREHLDAEALQNRLEYEKEIRLQGHQEYTDKADALSQREGVLSKTLKDLALEQSAYEAQLRKTQLDYNQTRVELNTATAQLNELNRQAMGLDAQKRAYDEMNFARPVEMAINSGISGIHGPIGQLGQVDSEFETSMGVAIGGRIQNVVVDDDQVAAEAIQYLKQNRGGRATFLPMNKIQGGRSRPPLPHGSGIIDYAINLIQFEPVYTDVFAYALGETLIVEDMESARQYLRKYRMVTLEGSLLERSGAMSGGSSPGGNRAGSRFANSGKIELEMERLARQVEKAEIGKEELEKKLTRLELKLDTLKNEYGQCVNNHTRCETELNSVQEQLTALKASFADSVDTSEADQKINDAQQAVSTLHAKLSTQEQGVQALKSELEAIEGNLPSDQMTELRDEMNNVKFQMDHYDAQIRNVQTDRQSKELEKNYQKNSIEEQKERIEQNLNQNIELNKEKLEHLEEIKLTLVQIQDLESQTSELDEELKKLQDERDKIQNRLIEEENKKNILERKIEQLDEQIIAFQTRKTELEPELLAVREELKAHGVEAENIALEDLPTGEEVAKNIARLTKRMEAMEPVNMLAVQEYDDVDGRRAELAEKIETLINETQAIQERIGGYEELKLSSFKKAFKEADQNFKYIFAELADGEGRLVLSNPEHPFEGGMSIMAQPRGKKLQRIEAMSGGEKSLTSLAFVFALQRYMPAPFYALDEVDMNLDGINAEKLAQMVKAESEKGAQFIVVSLRKPMIENSNRTIGVTQKRSGITRVTGVKIREETAPLSRLVADELSAQEINSDKTKKEPVSHEPTISS